MKQLTLQLKTGKIEVMEVPEPLLGPKMLLVQNRYSLISPGTEGSTVSDARKSLIWKAKSRPQQVKQMFEVLKQHGLVQAYRAARRKLESYSPLGYSSAGRVIKVGHDVTVFSEGDFVACGGAGYASHAEIVAVPVNLCVKLRPSSDLKKAAYNTLGSIALQGIRQADLKVGEICAVIGLGLIGQLTCLILQASGVKVIGIDIDPEMVKLASQHCASLALLEQDANAVEKIDEFTEGIGVDAVIISAATKSLAPINFAGRIARKRGRVIIVGNVPTGFEREPYYYQKELELRMSCSYGPGRYDSLYEEKGIDYPAGYVRWTENRNMKAFQELVYSGKIDMDYLTTHTFKLDNAPSAYDLITKRKEPFLGVLIEYETSKKKIEDKRIFSIQKLEAERQGLLQTKEAITPRPVTIGFIGAGNYAQSYLLPNLPGEKDVILKGVLAALGTESKTVAEKFKFEFCSSSENDILGNAEINTVFIATWHNTHAEFVLKALQAGKNVHVEKPLCINKKQLDEITAVYQKIYSLPQKDKRLPILMVGFNRRFSPLAEFLKKKLGQGPMSMIYRINAGPIPPESWIQDSEIGGGRIIGEVCHFVDFLTFINGSLPLSVFASALPEANHPEDTVNISLNFKNGSIGTISYFSIGSKSLFKEYLEIHRAGMSAVLKDFKELKIYSQKKPVKKKLLAQDKGQKKMIQSFLGSIKNGLPSPIPFEEIYAVTLATFKILESLRTKKAITLPL